MSVTSKSTGSSGKPSGGGSNTPTSSQQARSRKAGRVANKKSAAGKPIHGRYRFRYWIPCPLQKLIGQREVRRTLETKDRAEAIQAARPIFMELRETLLRHQGANCTA